MKKIIVSLFALIFLTVFLLGTFLSTKGYETDRFNSFISKKIKDNAENLEVSLEKIKVKLDLKKFNIFLSTNNPKIKYQNIDLPINKTDFYFDFFSIFTKEIFINRVNFSFSDLNISDLKKLIVRTKPSNIKSFISNNITKGTVSGSIDLNFLENLKLDSYKLRGSFKKTDINSFKKIKIDGASFNFIADPDLVLLNDISFNFMGIPVTNGSIKVEQKQTYLIEGSLSTNLNSDSKELSKFIKLLPNLDISNKNFKIKGNFLNKFKFNLDNTLKLKNYDYALTGSQIKAKIIFDKEFKSSYLKYGVKEIFFDESNLKYDLSKKRENQLFIEGIYKFFENKKYQKYKIENIFNDSSSKFNINLDFDQYIVAELLNYEKKEDKVAKIDAAFRLADSRLKLDSVNYSEGKNLISLKKLEINKNRIKNFKNIKVKTFKNGKENNNFEISFGKKILVKGKSYDSSNLIRKLNNKKRNDLLEGVNKEINISFDKIFTKLSLPLNKFNLLGKIEKGKFVKISSKSEFSENKYLDITLKKDLNKNRKTLEVYSGLAKPLLTDFNFFKGIEGGQLLFTSVFDDITSTSNLRIEDFKVLNAPAFAKLLALADLTGPAVLLSGEGLSFDLLEIKFTDDEQVRTINEIYAVGPSITILMEGYVENKTGLTSLRGTMVPAKEINKLISKIPLIGDILIGKEIGEGVFGVSFKMKGPPGKIKTTVNPIKTLTPRFITRALEKRKKENKNN